MLLIEHSFADVNISIFASIEKYSLIFHSLTFVNSPLNFSAVRANEHLNC